MATYATNGETISWQMTSRLPKSRCFAAWLPSLLRLRLYSHQNLCSSTVLGKPQLSWKRKWINIRKNRFLQVTRSKNHRVSLVSTWASYFPVESCFKRSTCVHTVVGFQLVLEAELLPAAVTFIGFLPGVDALVALQRALISEAAPAELALKWVVPG